MKLVDVSAAQKISLYEWADADIAGAYVNLGTGSDHDSPARLTHCQNLRRLGFPVGPYHVCTPSNTNGDAQEEAAKFFLSTTICGPFDLIPALDIEHAVLTPNELAMWAITWHDSLNAGKCLLYGNKSVVRHLGHSDYADELRECFELWLASDTIDVPTPSPWGKAVLWQSPVRHVGWTRTRIDVDEAPFGLLPLRRS